jgi:hypothetical protein
MSKIYSSLALLVYIIIVSACRIHINRFARLQLRYLDCMQICCLRTEVTLTCRIHINRFARLQFRFLYYMRIQLPQARGGLPTILALHVELVYRFARLLLHYLTA